MKNDIIIYKEPILNNNLQLCPIKVKENYCKKWNVNLTDFVCLAKGGELLRPTLYRVGGLDDPKIGVDNYFMLLKYVEAFYDREILKMTNGEDPKHLEGRWCIIDKFGNEKVVFDLFKHPYLIKNSVIYSIDNDYYNIETGEHYGASYSSIKSSEYLFLDNYYSKDKNKQGVMKINLRDGTWELFK